MNKFKIEQKTEGNEPREINKDQYQGNHNKRRNDKSRKSVRLVNGDTFRGDHKDLLGYVYTYDSAARANQYEKTTEKVAQWAKKELAFNMDIWDAIQNLEEPDTNSWKPEAPKDEDPLDKAIFNEEVKEYMLRKRTYNNNRSKVYTVVLGQCFDTMKARLEGQSDWEDIHKKHDLVKLLKSVKVWMLNQQSSKSPAAATYS